MHRTGLQEILDFKILLCTQRKYLLCLCHPRTAGLLRARSTSHITALLRGHIRKRLNTIPLLLIVVLKTCPFI